LSKCDSGTEVRHAKIWLDTLEYSVDDKNISERLFETKEECQYKCDELNNKGN
jgi:hypothetical protein